MLRAGFLLLLLVALLHGGSGAVAPGPPRVAPFPPSPAAEPARYDTVWFGGDDGTGVAYQGGVWDWEVTGGDPLQGWIERDLTADPADYFRWVTADSFAAHGDPCVPMLPPAPGSPANLGQIWCGVHQDEALDRDFATGMGYGNNSRQHAVSPRLAIVPGAGVGIAFRYFNDSEDGFDRTDVLVNCYDSGGTLLGWEPVASLTGIHGDPAAPAQFADSVRYAELHPGTVEIELEFSFYADGGWSDEDGHWNTDCGPFAADDVGVNVGGVEHVYDFETGRQGWTLERLPGIGSFMAPWPEATWRGWLEDVGVTCECPLEGNALGFVTEDVPYPLPGFPEYHHTYAMSGVVDRGPYVPPEYNAVNVRMAVYLFLTLGAGSFVRPGWIYYPYSTEVNPSPHWSPRGGQDVYAFGGDSPICEYAGPASAFDLTHPPDGDPIPPTWEKMRFVYELATDPILSIPPLREGVGETYGSPLVDRVQVGVTYAPDAPPIAAETGLLFQDGFGQRSPEYLDPGDVGNANTAFDLRLGNPYANDWLADTSVVVGPAVNATQPRRWLARFCVKVDRKGPRQDWIPGYLAWRNRLAYLGNPEQDFVCVLMDSAQNYQGTAARNKFVTYFHETEPGFDPAHPDYTSWQEILPDGIWVPGTRIAYRYEARWQDADEWFVHGPFEFEVLPGMRAAAGGEYDVEWPCALFVDAFGRGTARYLEPALQQIGLELDRYDYRDAAGSWSGPLRRSYGGGVYNPGGWGNNGGTLNQLLGYRLILLDTGSHGVGIMDPADFELIGDWLATTECGLADTRRGIVLSGDEIAAIVEDHAPGLLAQLGAARIGPLASDGPCIWLEPPSPPALALRASCATTQELLGVAPGVPGAAGTLSYRDFGWPPGQFADYARVVRQNQQPQVADWRSSVHGFALHRLALVGCGGEPCGDDSACIAAGIARLLSEEIAWISAGGAPFVAWRYPCRSDAVDESGETHLSGPVDHLYTVGPNPTRGAVRIRFHLAQPGEATLRIHDLEGRCIRTLAQGARAAGEQTCVWDGTDDRGRRRAAGMYWARLSTARGYASSLRLLRLD